VARALHLIRFHGVLAPHATLRSQIVPSAAINAPAALRSARPGCARLNARAHEFGVLGSKGVFDTDSELPPALWRALEDHSRHH
jgi:hypothetical protein